MALEQQQLEAGIAALEAQRAALGDAVVDAALAGLRARLAALQAPVAEPASPLGQVSILFLDVVGSTALGQHLDPEEISAVMDGALARGTAIVEAHRGKVLQYAGDNLLAAFGADGAAEDDAERAVRCGLALLALGRTLGDEVRAAHRRSGVDVRVGIHTGGVLLGAGVDDDGSIRGQAVNIAARMEQTAPPGSLRISHDTYAGCAAHSTSSRRSRSPSRASTQPVRSYLVVRARPRPFKAGARGIEGVETRMIGRDAELEALQRAFERVAQPGAGMLCVTVVGEAGVGKSRLLHEFGNWVEARIGRAGILQARATPQMQGQPYGLLHDLFARRWQLLDADSMEAAKGKLESALASLFAADGEIEAQAQAHRLGQLIGLDYGESRHVRGIRDDAREIRSRGFDAAAQALRRIGARSGGPLVVQLDDLHWADEGTLDFIEHLAQVAGDVPMLLLALARPTLFERRAGALRGVAGGAAQRIDLRPLDEAGSRRLADELLKRLAEAPAALRELVAGRAAGNPFYMEELVKMLIDRGAIAADAERWTVDSGKLESAALPATLTGVLQARLDSLRPPEKQALQLASVIGLTFWDAALAHVEPAAPAQLPRLQARALIRAKAVAITETDTDLREFAFDHQILHQVTYDTVLKGVRRRAHARVADWLAHHAGAVGNSLLGAAAWHYEQAGDAAQAAEFYARAAEHEAGLFVHEAALDEAAHALRLAGDDAVDLRWRVLAARERVLDLLGRREAQRADIEALAALAAALPAGTAGDARRADVAWRRADFAHRTGDWETQEREAAHAQGLAERAGDEPLALRAIQRRAQAAAYRGRPEEGRALAEAGLAWARRLGAKAEESSLLNALTVCTDLLGDRVAGLQQSLLDLALDREAGHRRNEAVALSNVGMSWLAFGALGEARRHLEEALRLNRALGNRQVEGNTHSILSELAWREGNGALAASHARDAHRIAVEVDSRLHQVDSLWSLGNAELALGDVAAAAAAFERSEALAHETGLVPQVLNALDGQARVALARGDAAQARHFAEQLLARAQAAAPGAAAGSAQGEDASDGDAPSTQLLAGTYEHLIRLTLHRAWAGADAPRADQLLVEAHAALAAEADRIHDAALRASFLADIAEHREIMALWTRRQPDGH